MRIVQVNKFREKHESNYSVIRKLCRHFVNQFVNSEKEYASVFSSSSDVKSYQRM